MSRRAFVLILGALIALLVFLDGDSTRRGGTPSPPPGESGDRTSSASKLSDESVTSPRTIRGRVLLPDGSAAPRSTVRLLSVDWPSRLPLTGALSAELVRKDGGSGSDDTLAADLTDSWRPVAEVSTDEDGRFRFEAVATGTWLVCAATPDSIWSTDGALIPFSGDGDLSVTTTLSLRPPHELQLLVTQDGLPAEGVRISLLGLLDEGPLSPATLWERILNPSPPELRTDGRGFAEARRLPPLDFRVRAESAEARPVENTYSVWEPGVNCERSESGELIRIPTRPMRIRLIGGITVEGVVRDAAGSPIEAARVELFREPGLSREPPAGAPPMDLITTDAEGRYRFERVQPGVCTIRVNAEGFAPQSRSDLYTEAIVGTSVDFELVPATILRGVVRDEKGAPLADVRIQSLRELGNFVHSDREGRFEIRAKDDRGELTYVLKACYSSPGWHFLRADQFNEITLQTLDAFRGRVLDPEGQPIEGAVIEATRGGNRSGSFDPSSGAILSSGPDDVFEPKPIRTDASGVFTGCPTGAGPTVDVLQIHAVGYEHLLIPVGEGRNGDFGDLVLQRLSTLEGTVFDPAGAPRSGAKVRVEGGGWNIETNTGESGRYRLPIPRAGEAFSARADHPRFRPSEKTPLPVTRSGDSLSLDLFLSPGAGVEFRILLDGVPPPPSSVELATRSEASLLGAGTIGISDDEGVVRLEGLLPGTYRYLLECPGAGSRRGEVTLVTGEVLVVPTNLTTTETLQIVVTDPAGRVPEGTTVVVNSAGYQLEGTQESDGSFSVVGHSPGAVLVKATAPGHTRAKTGWIDPQGEPIRILLERSTELTIQIIDALDGRPLPEASVWDFKTREFQSVDVNGTALIRHLPPGEHRFAIGLQNYQLQFPVVSIGAFPELLTVSLDRGREIEVEVVDPRGNPLGGVELRLDPGRVKGEGAGSWRWETDDSGRARIGGLTFGDHFLVATRENHRSRRVDFQLRDGGGALTVSVVLEPIAMVSGRVLDANGRPVRGAVVSLQRAGEAVLESRESGYSDGRFRFPEVLPGRYRIVARSDDREASVEIEVTGTEAEEVELQF